MGRRAFQCWMMGWWKSQRRGSFQTDQQCDQVNLGWDSSSLGPVGHLADLDFGCSSCLAPSPSALSFLISSTLSTWWSWCECDSKGLTMTLRGKPTPGQVQCWAWEGWNGRIRPSSMWGLRMSLRITNILGQTIRFYAKILLWVKITRSTGHMAVSQEYKRYTSETKPITEYDLPPCEARGWNGGSQASLDKILGSVFFWREFDKEYGSPVCQTSQWSESRI